MLLIGRSVAKPMSVSIISAGYRQDLGLLHLNLKGMELSNLLK